MMHWVQDVYNRSHIFRIEDLIEEGLPKKDIYMVDGNHPEEDELKTLDDEGYQEYQMFIGILN